jgi:hypothetical protein
VLLKKIPAGIKMTLGVITSERANHGGEMTDKKQDFITLMKPEQRGIDRRNKIL